MDEYSHKIISNYFSYDEKGNNQMNFTLKVQKLQTNLASKICKEYELKEFQFKFIHSHHKERTL